MSFVAHWFRGVEFQRFVIGFFSGRHSWTNKQIFEIWHIQIDVLPMTQDEGIKIK